MFAQIRAWLRHRRHLQQCHRTLMRGTASTGTIETGRAETGRTGFPLTIIGRRRAGVITANITIAIGGEAGSRGSRFLAADIISGTTAIGTRPTVMILPTAPMLTMSQSMVTMVWIPHR